MGGTAFCWRTTSPSSARTWGCRGQSQLMRVVQFPSRWGARCSSFLPPTGLLPPKAPSLMQIQRVLAADLGTGQQSLAQGHRCTWVYSTKVPLVAAEGRVGKRSPGADALKEFRAGLARGPPAQTLGKNSQLASCSHK